MRSFYLLPLFILFFSGLCRAAGDPVNIAGDYLEYRMEKEEIVARGNAIVYQGKMRITADIIHACMKSDDVFAYGAVVLWQDAQKTEADILTYNLATGIGSMKKATLNQKGSIISADQLDIAPRFMRGRDISWTTCDNEAPHYRFTASEILIIPGDTITLKNSKLWAGNRLLYNMGDKVYGKEVKRAYKTGYSKTDGLTLSAGAPVEGFLGGDGQFNFDLRQKRGSNLGLSLDRPFFQGKSTINISGYIPKAQGERKDITARIALDPGKLWGRVSNSTTLDFYAREVIWNESVMDQELMVRNIMNFTDKKERVDVNITVDRRFDLEGDKYSGDSGMRLLEKNPELEARFKPFRFKTKMGTTNANFRYTGGHYRENDIKPLSAQKHQGELSIVHPTLKLGPTSLSLSTDGAWAWYSTQDFRSVYFNRARFNVTPIKKFNSSFQYEDKVVDGESPFSFDPQSPYKRLSISHVYSMNRLITIKPLSYSIDLKRHYISSLVSDITVNQSDGRNNWDLYFRTSYANTSAMGNKRFLPDLDPVSYYFRWGLSPKRDIWRFSWSSTWNKERNSWVDHNIGAKYRIGNKLIVDTSLRYDVAAQKFGTQNHDLVYDMHCSEIRASWNVNRQEIWFETYFKSFPQKKQRMLYEIENSRLKPTIKNFDY